eukprot:TRINITY_DN12240_c0_g1_i1.p1 TRINITY_DN12240_c0_g1~~TRINITY_DN12240_c0_g1_i1.p1  ORF type:complete len:228 (-),score=29.36 TRINITY_DN12240_c0_g1_i1:324-1007(-)
MESSGRQLLEFLRTPWRHALAPARLPYFEACVLLLVLIGTCRGFDDALQKAEDAQTAALAEEGYANAALHDPSQLSAFITRIVDERNATVTSRDALKDWAIHVAKHPPKEFHMLENDILEADWIFRGGEWNQSACALPDLQSFNKHQIDHMIQIRVEPQPSVSTISSPFEKVAALNRRIAAEHGWCFNPDLDFATFGVTAETNSANWVYCWLRIMKVAVRKGGLSFS